MRQGNDDIDGAADTSGLDNTVRDVFAALELGAPAPAVGPPVRGKAPIEESHRQALQAELADVQAVLIIVDRDQPLSDHRKLLSLLAQTCGKADEDDQLLSGFDLAISLVVALPSPLHDASAPSSLAHTARSDEVEEIYAGEGWEYVDLTKVESFLDEGESDADDIGDNQHGEDDDEKHGIERIREALMTHTWPNLQRKGDRKRAGVRSGTVSLQDETEDSLTHTLNKLRLDLDAIDDAGAAEPTQKDEELARAFLARIEAAQSAGLGQDDPLRDATEPLRSRADMQSALESFLESEDTHWPAAAGKPGANGGLTQSQEEGWPAREPSANGTDQVAFEDDFADFVQADPSSEGMPTGGSADLLGHNEFDEQEPSFVGDADDAMLLRTLAQRPPGGGEDVQIDFESTLQAVLAQAERVRAIPDHEQRREEAARVALALLDQ